MLIRDKKYFEGFRWFALFTLLCTVVMWIVLWSSSATPGEISGANSWAMAGALDGKYDISQKFDSTITTQDISPYRSAWSANYIGDQEQLYVSYSPKNTTDTEVEWSSGNENVATVDKNGLVTLIGRGEVRIYTKLKSNPKIINYVYFLCYGANPENIDNPNIKFRYENSTQYLANNEIAVGKSAVIDLNDNKTSTLATKFTTSDESVAIVNAGCLVPKKAGTVTVTAKYTTGYEISCDVTVADNPNFIKPTEIVLQDENINQGDIINVYSFVKEALPSGASSKCIVNIEQSKTVAFFRNDNLHVSGYGEFALTFTSCYDENVKASITLFSNRKMPSELRVSAPSIASPNNNYYLKAVHYPTDPYSDEVKWEIVSGKYASIDENGLFRPRFFGTYVIRCTSTIDPSLCVEKTIEVKLFDDVGGFVRKLMGHMGLSGVLGFGLFFTCLFLCKRKWKCAVYPFVISFVHGGLSEAIQYFTPGRMCTFADVLVDFMGGCIGIGIGMVLAGIILLIWRLANKQSFDRTIYAIKSLNFGNCFKKMPKFDAEYAREDVETQPKEDETQANAVA